MGRRRRDLGRRRAIHPQGAIWRGGGVAPARHLRDARRPDAGGQRQRLCRRELAGDSAPRPAGRHPRADRRLFSDRPATRPARHSMGRRCRRDIRNALLWRRRSAGRPDVSPAGRLAGGRDAGCDRRGHRGRADRQERSAGDCLRGDDGMVVRKVRRRAMARNPLAVRAAVRSGICTGAGPRKSPGRAHRDPGAERLVRHADVAQVARSRRPERDRWRPCDLGRLHGDRAAGAGAGLARRVPRAAAMGRLDFRGVALR